MGGAARANDWKRWGKKLQPIKTNNPFGIIRENQSEKNNNRRQSRL
jgi:hypothetical protein